MRPRSRSGLPVGRCCLESRPSSRFWAGVPESVMRGDLPLAREQTTRNAGRKRVPPWSASRRTNARPSLILTTQSFRCDSTHIPWCGLSRCEVSFSQILGMVWKQPSLIRILREYATCCSVRLKLWSGENSMISVRWNSMPTCAGSVEFSNCSRNGKIPEINLGTSAHRLEWASINRAPGTGTQTYALSSRFSSFILESNW